MAVWCEQSGRALGGLASVRIWNLSGHISVENWYIAEKRCVICEEKEINTSVPLTPYVIATISRQSGSEGPRRLISTPIRTQSQHVVTKSQHYVVFDISLRPIIMEKLIGRTGNKASHHSLGDRVKDAVTHGETRTAPEGDGMGRGLVLCKTHGMIGVRVSPDRVCTAVRMDSLVLSMCSAMHGTNGARHSS